MRVLNELSTLPSITGLDTKENTVELTSLLVPGRYALVWWHPQALSPIVCKTCQGSRHGLVSEPIKLLQGIYDAGCEIIGLTYESPQRTKRYLQDIGIEYPIISADEKAAQRHTAAKGEGEQWISIPRRIAFLIDDTQKIINRYDVHEPVTFLRTVIGDVKSGPPASKWEPAAKRKKFFGIF